MACQDPATAKMYTFCDTTLDLDARVADLVARVHDEDKPGLGRASHGCCSDHRVTGGLVLSFPCTCPTLSVSAPNFLFASWLGCNASGHALHHCSQAALENVLKLELELLSPLLASTLLKTTEKAMRNPPLMRVVPPRASRAHTHARANTSMCCPGLLTARAQQPLGYIGVPAYYWGTNCIASVENGAHGEATPCPHGVCSTHFPNPPNMMSSFNKSAIRAIGRIMSA
jgi:hypothetical protein